MTHELRSLLSADDSDLTLSLAESGVLELGLVECAGLNFDTKAPFAVYLLAFYTLWRGLPSLCAVACRAGGSAVRLLRLRFKALAGAEGCGRARRGILLTLPMAWHTAVLSTDAYDVKAKAYYKLTTTLVTRDVQFCFWFHNIAAA